MCNAWNSLQNSINQISVPRDYEFNLLTRLKLPVNIIVLVEGVQSTLVWTETI